MQELVTGSLFIFAEIGGVLLLVFIFLAWKMIGKKSRRRKHVSHFMESYNEHKNENSSAAISRLETSCNMEHEDAEKAVTRINANERIIYRHILNLMLGKEENNTFKIQERMEELSNSWVDTLKSAMKNGGTAEGGEGKMDMAHMRKQVDFLKDENSRLSENYLHVRSRLETAVELLGNLVKEYSMLYADGDESNQVVEAIEEELNEIKKAMQEADEKAKQSQSASAEQG